VQGHNAYHGDLLVVGVLLPVALYEALRTKTQIKQNNPSEPEEQTQCKLKTNRVQRADFGANRGAQ
jgi:hypothetical protein